MDRAKTKYHLPRGYSLLQTILKSRNYVKDPIGLIQHNMNLFGGTYSVAIGLKRKLIITQDSGWVNYILKDNHKNYRKSPLASEKAIQFFGNGLLLSNGTFWLRQRRLMQPAFHKDKLKGLEGIVSKSINASLEVFPTGDLVDVCPVLQRISFDVLLASIFDIDLSAGLKDEIGSIFYSIQEFLVNDTNLPLKKLGYFFTREKTKVLTKSKRLRQIFGEIIIARRSGDGNYSDLLDMLLHTKYEDTGEYMNHEQVIDELIILVFAGHETTANTLSWLLYLLSTNTDKYEKLRNELQGTPVQESLQNSYMRGVIQEGLRLYPAAWMTEREAITDDSFGDYHYPKGSIIISFFFGLHRNETLWENADRFIPERFIAEPNPARSKNYFAFGAGPRMCIGNNFAMMEISYFLFQFLEEFTIAPTGQVPKTNPLITLNADKVLLGIKRK